MSATVLALLVAVLLVAVLAELDCWRCRRRKHKGKLPEDIQ